MKETSQLTGYTYEMIKFYCNKGLIPNVKQEKITIGSLINQLLIRQKVYPIWNIVNEYFWDSRILEICN